MLEWNSIASMRVATECVYSRNVNHVLKFEITKLIPSITMLCCAVCLWIHRCFIVHN